MRRRRETVYDYSIFCENHRSRFGFRSLYRFILCVVRKAITAVYTLSFCLNVSGRTVPLTRARVSSIFNASSSRPLASSHLGDSGKNLRRVNPSSETRDLIKTISNYSNDAWPRTAETVNNDPREFGRPKSRVLENY